MQRAPTYVKALVFGPCRAGKTSIVCRLKPDTSFSAEYTPTIGVNVNFVRGRFNVNGTAVCLNAWDYSRYRSITQGSSSVYFLKDHGYSRQSDIAVLVFDASDVASMCDAVAWLKSNDTGIPASCIKALVANKVDSAAPEVLAEGRDAARAFGWMFFETSARDNTGIAEMFEALILALFQRRGVIALTPAPAPAPAPAPTQAPTPTPTPAPSPTPSPAPERTPAEEPLPTPEPSSWRPACVIC